MPDTFLLASKQVLLPDGLQPATLTIGNGRILSVVRERLASTKANPVHDVGESVIMPGLIDCNVRINEPGRTDWEGFSHATAAAAAGGVTTIIDLPLDASPCTTNLNALKEKIKSADGSISVNCGLWGGIIPGSKGQIGSLKTAGVMGYCIFLGDSGNSEFPPLAIKELESIAEALSKTGLPVCIFPKTTSGKGAKSPSLKDKYSYDAYLRTHSASEESKQIEKIIEIAGQHGLRLHIMGMSAAQSLPAIRKAKDSGLSVTTETNPHHLFFHSEEIPDQDPRFKCSPPIRDKQNNSELWAGLGNNTIDFISSSHQPMPAELKELQSGDIESATAGIASLQFILPIMWTLALKDKTPLQRVSEWMSEHPAKFLGLETKGRIAEGMDADLVVWDPTKKIKVNSNTVRSRHKLTPYEGIMLSGIIQETWVGGELVYDRGAFPNSAAGKILLKSF